MAKRWTASTASSSSEREDDVAGAALLQLAPGGFQDHLAPLAVCLECVPLVMEVDGLTVEIASQMELTEPAAGFLLGLLPTQLDMGMRLHRVSGYREL